MGKQVDLNIPALPNFITGKDGDKNLNIPVEDLTDDQLKFIGSIWTKALITHAQNKRSFNKKLLEPTPLSLAIKSTP